MVQLYEELDKLEEAEGGQGSSTEEMPEDTMATTSTKDD